MIEFLHSFALGVSFVAGTFSGVVVAAFVMRATANKERRDAKEAASETIAILKHNSATFERIATLLESRAHQEGGAK